MIKTLLITIPLAFSLIAQQAEPEPEVAAGVEIADPVAEEIGANHQRILNVEEWQAPDGKIQRHTNVFTQLELGLNRKDAEGRWVPAFARFASEDGWAVAREGQHGVSVYYNINAEGAIVLDPPGGQRMRSHLLGLVYHDVSSGESVLIGEIQDSRGMYLNESQILFENAFSGISADVRYTYAKSGFSQDIILREQPPEPASYGLNADTTRLEVWTEFVEGPDPVRVATILNREAVDAGRAAPLQDEELSFGSMRIGLGRAFSLGDESDSLGFVAKSWNVTPEGRRFLIETVEVSALEQDGELPPNSGGASRPVRRGNREQILAGLPAKQSAQPGGSFRTANTEGLVAISGKRGVVVDYTILNPSYSGLTFKGDETYYVSGLITCSGTTTFEGGAVIKFANTNTPKIELTGSSVFPSTTMPAGSPYRPIIFTAKDDNTVGETISGSSGSPSGYYADIALKWGNATTAIDARNLRFVRAKTGISLNSGSGHKFRHVQFVDCESAMRPTSTDFGLHNALCTGVTYIFNGSSATGRVEHATVNGATALNYNSTFGSGNLRMTNSLVLAVTTVGSLTATNKVAVLSSSSGIFATQVAGGAHYLASGSPYRDIGVAVSSELTGDLPQLTTYPPTRVTSTINSATTLYPASSRDTNTLDLGYHYAPIDYLFSADPGVVVTNAVLTLKDGVVISHDDITPFFLTGSSSLASVGLPHKPNVFTYYTTVQEKKSAYHDGGTKYAFYSYGAYNAGSRSATISFTTFEGATLPFYTVLYWADGFVTHQVSYRDSQFIYTDAYLESYLSDQYTITMINNLWVRPSWSVFGPFNEFLANQTVYGGSFSIIGYGLDWRDSLLHSASISLDKLSGGITNQNNLFVSLTSFSSTGSNVSCITNSPFNFASGTLGPWYHSSTTGVNQGSRTADTASLYHHTVKTDQSKDGATTVDIGFHYVAMYGSVPIDYDGDGVPDYLEDINGNGLLNSGETNTNSITDLGFKIIITEPKSNGIVP